VLATRRLCAVLAAGLLCAPAWADERIAVRAELVASFDAPEAGQGVAVDARFFYAIDNRRIGKYDRQTGERLAAWTAPEDAPIVHLNSGVVVDDKLYIAHSNYPGWPMTSSVEIWDAATLEHIGSHSFRVERGWLTWLDRHDGAWWGAFANYDGIGELASSGNENTQIVRFGSDWRVAQAWVLPQPLLDRFGEMSNSGGSWGPDGRLWISGHDRPEAYVVTLPESGSVLRWVATVPLDIAGQGIAWDRVGGRMIWGVVRNGATGGSRVTASRVALP
jgi:hypothetical protein